MTGILEHALGLLRWELGANLPFDAPIELINKYVCSTFAGGIWGGDRTALACGFDGEPRALPDAADREREDRVPEYMQRAGRVAPDLDQLTAKGQCRA
jgi:hypothetical protein